MFNNELPNPESGRGGEVYLPLVENRTNSATTTEKKAEEVQERV